MAVQVEFTEETNISGVYMTYCQTILEAFTKALDKNECNVRVLISAHNEIKDQQDELKDLYEITQKDSKLPVDTSKKIYIRPKNPNEIIRTLIDNPDKPIDNIALDALKNGLNDDCIDCKFKFPKINFTSNLRFSFEKLKLSLKAYMDAFSELTNPNLCHSAAVFNYSCMQELLEMLVLLITLYTALLKLSSLSGISLNGFIKGVVSGLLGAIIGSVKIQVDLSNTGISCLLNALHTLADRFPSGSNMVGYVPDEWLEEQEKKEAEDIEQEKENRSYNPFSADAVANALKALQDETIDTFTKAQHQNIIKRFTNELQKTTEEYEKLIDNSLKFFDNVASKAQENLNKKIASMFGLMDHFQCEAARTGTGIMELLPFIQQVIQVINLVSALIAQVANRQVMKMCKPKSGVVEYSDELKEELEKAPMDWIELVPADLISEFMGQEVIPFTEGGSNNNDIIPIILDKPKQTILPKLSLDNCNLQDFIDAHKPDNILKAVIEDIRKKNEVNPTTPREYVTGVNITPDRFNRDSFIYDKLPYQDVDTTTEQITRTPFEEVTNNGRWKLYPIQFVKPVFDYDTLNYDGNIEENKRIIEKNNDTSYGIKTILDFIYNNPTDKISDISQNNKQSNLTDYFKPNVSDTNVVYKPVNNNKTNLKNPEESLYKEDSASYLNTCRDINDVLGMLEELKRS